LTNLNPLPFAHQLAGYSHLPRLSSSFLVAFYLCRQFINAKGGVGGGGGVAANCCNLKTFLFWEYFFIF